MTTLTRIVAATALTGIIFANAGTTQAADAASVLTMREKMQGISFDVGSQRAVSYFLSSNGTCRLIVTMAEPLDRERDDDHVYSFTATRFEAAIPAGKATRFKPAHGKALEFACHAGARSMSIRPVEPAAERQEHATQVN